MKKGCKCSRTYHLTIISRWELYLISYFLIGIIIFILAGYKLQNMQQNKQTKSIRTHLTLTSQTKGVSGHEALTQTQPWHIDIIIIWEKESFKSSHICWFHVGQQACLWLDVSVIQRCLMSDICSVSILTRHWYMVTFNGFYFLKLLSVLTYHRHYEVVSMLQKRVFQPIKYDNSNQRRVPCLSRDTVPHISMKSTHIVTCKYNHFYFLKLLPYLPITIVINYKNKIEICPYNYHN